MKESMSGTWFFGIIALFIVLFASFMAYSISYTKAFKVKNHIIDYIEQNEGFTKAIDVDHKDVKDLTIEELRISSATDAKAYDSLEEIGYNKESIICGQAGEEQYGGYCVKRVCYTESLYATSNAKTKYVVTTFIKIRIPVININIKLPISGETNPLFYESKIASSYQCWTEENMESYTLKAQ